MAYTDSVESKRLTEAMIMAKFIEWLETIRPLLECAKFRGRIILRLHLNVAKGDCKIHQFIYPE